MGLFDKAKDAADKAKDVAEDNAGKIADGVDKATDVIDDKTGGKFHDQLEKVDDAAAKFAKKSEDGDDA